MNDDQTVDVSFDPDGTEQFRFEPESVTMRAAGKIIFHKRPANAAWKFRGGDVKDDKLKQFSASVHGNGRNLHIDDEFRDGTRTAYEYRITVELDGQVHESPDPVIVNDPGR